MCWQYVWNETCGGGGLRSEQEPIILGGEGSASALRPGHAEPAEKQEGDPRGGSPVRRGSAEAQRQSQAEWALGAEFGVH